MKPRKLELSYPWVSGMAKSPSYRVEKVTNSVAIEAGAFLTKQEVETWVQKTNWTVTIKTAAKAGVA